MVEEPENKIDHCKWKIYQKNVFYEIVKVKIDSSKNEIS